MGKKFRGVVVQYSARGHGTGFLSRLLSVRCSIRGHRQVLVGGSTVPAQVP